MQSGWLKFGGSRAADAPAATVLRKSRRLECLRVMTELQSETVALAPDGPNVIRARRWLAGAAELLA